MPNARATAMSQTTSHADPWGRTPTAVPTAKTTARPMITRTTAVIA